MRDREMWGVLFMDTVFFGLRLLSRVDPEALGLLSPRYPLE